MKHIVLKLTPKEAEALDFILQVAETGLHSLVGPVPDNTTVTRLVKKFLLAAEFDPETGKWGPA